MSLTIINIASRTDHQKERIILKVRKDLNLDDYAISDGRDHHFQFPNLQAKENDIVLLYSGTGAYSVEPGVFEVEPLNIHSFYWDLQAFFADGNFTVVKL